MEPLIVLALCFGGVIGGFISGLIASCEANKKVKQVKEEYRLLREELLEEQMTKRKLTLYLHRQQRIYFLNGVTGRNVQLFVDYDAFTGGLPNYGS